jgi:diguanylate cyclase (GGDEF)-like protein
MNALRQFLNPQTTIDKNILIVDDTPANLQLLTVMLKSQGYQVRSALNGAMALLACNHQIPDLVLLDVVMPEMSGYQVCEKLKTSSLTATIPVIFISALGQATEKIKGFEAGGADYITKPFQAEEVLVRVKYQLLLQDMQEQLQRQNLLLERQNSLLQKEIDRRKRTEIALAQANYRFRQLASKDGLTGLANRRQFDQYLEQEWEQSIQKEEEISLILCDVDQFKNYNDTYGHPAGDGCLAQIAEAISRAVKRPQDLVARYGGEEFVLVLPNTSVAGAVQVAQDIQKEVRSKQIFHRTSTVDQYITVSLGICTMLATPQRSSIELLSAADQALYQAKQSGRNRYYVNDESLNDGRL